MMSRVSVRPPSEAERRRYNLATGEAICTVLRRHPVVLAKPVGALLLPPLAAIAKAAGASPAALVAGVAWLGVTAVAMWLVGRWWRMTRPAIADGEARPASLLDSAWVPMASWGLCTLLAFRVASVTSAKGLITLLFLLWLGGAGYAAWRIPEWWVAEYIITNRRIVTVAGIIPQRRTVSFGKITDTMISRSFAGWILGYGDLVVDTPGQHPGVPVLETLARPEKVQQMIWDIEAGNFPEPPPPPRPVPEQVYRMDMELEGEPD